ncbi:MAG: type II toxin-antitoxin system VapC family toxin [Desulfomonilaceae bacterium]
MKRKRTYVDASVLIAAFQGEGATAQRAFAILDDPDRTFIVSDYLRLEVIPKPTFYGRQEEIAFMEQALSQGENISTSSDLTEKPLEMASKYDMTPMDALHVGAAAIAGVDELVTMEKPTKPICKVGEIKVVSIHSHSEASRSD